MIDFHIHTRYSDGSDSIEQIFEKGSKIGLKALSITDHDLLAKPGEGEILSKKYGIEFINGVEISTRYKEQDIHILAYLYDMNSQKLKDGLEKVVKARTERNFKMIEKLQSLGYDIEYNELPESDNNLNRGRPHIAKVLIKKGYFDNMKDVFNSLLAYGKPGYVDRYMLNPFEALKLIKEGRGVAVLAHPTFYFNKNRDKLEDFIKELKDKGLDGIETYYSTYTRAETDYIKSLSKKFDLIKTGGSDYHGIYKPAIKLGRGLGSLYVDHSIYENLLNYHKKYVI